jgi:hypothetical protein
MGRRFLLVLLALGSVAGFAAGFQSWRWHREFGWGPHAAWHQGPMEAQLDRVAEACVRAAERVHGAPNAAPAPP